MDVTFTLLSNVEDLFLETYSTVSWTSVVNILNHYFRDVRNANKNNLLRKFYFEAELLITGIDIFPKHKAYAVGLVLNTRLKK